MLPTLRSWTGLLTLFCLLGNPLTSRGHGLERQQVVSQDDIARFNRSASGWKHLLSLVRNDASEKYLNYSAARDFNCQNDASLCLNSGVCPSSGKPTCDCIPGFGGNDCSEPLCDSPNADTRTPRGNKPRCDCTDGWDGINCNVCERDDVCRGDYDRCNKSPLIVREKFASCSVNNRGFQQFLPAINVRDLNVTIRCTKNPDSSQFSCSIQFWMDREESFFCGFEQCSLTVYQKENRAIYDCKKLKCQCIPDRWLCGKDGGIDLGENLFMPDPDDPDRPTVKGPATVICNYDPENLSIAKCEFTEGGLAEFLQIIIAEKIISMDCNFGECQSQLDLPIGRILDSEKDDFAQYVLFGGSIISVFLIALGIHLAKRTQERQKQEAMEWYRQHGINADGVDDNGLEEEMRKKLMMAGHVPMGLQFSNVSYVVNLKKNGNGVTVRKVFDPLGFIDRAWNGLLFVLGRSRRASIAPTDLSSSSAAEALAESISTGAVPNSDPDVLVVLDGVHGKVEPGQVMAIMGGSGAGKTTFLDILAKKNKTGLVTGEVLVNGRQMSDDNYKRIIGYVDQETYLMDTLTVYEAILYSALLRLPTDMPLAAKKFRVQETMMELGISGIANRRIGREGSRGISGGEKRRVSIACELVTSPSILFLDEPTSGLDSFNAYNVIESVVSLARTYQRTIITTIHQPRSNIYALFDQLVLLAKGRMVYSGPAQKEAIEHFAKLGFTCPIGFNIADYLVDLTMHSSSADRAGNDTESVASGGNSHTNSPERLQPSTNLESANEDSSLSRSGSPLVPSKRKTVREAQEEALFTRRKPPTEDDESSHSLMTAEDDEAGIEEEYHEDEYQNGIDHGQSSAEETDEHESPTERTPLILQKVTITQPADLQPSASSNVRTPRRSSPSRSKTPLSRFARMRRVHFQPGRFSGGVYISSHLQMLIDGYRHSETYQKVQSSIRTLKNMAGSIDNIVENRHQAISQRRGRSWTDFFRISNNSIRLPDSDDESLNTSNAQQRPRIWKRLFRFSGNQLQSHDIENDTESLPEVAPSPQPTRGPAISSENTVSPSPITTPTTIAALARMPMTTQGNNRPGWWSQLKILSERAFKNLYRNPQLLIMHYVISFAVAVQCGIVYWQLDLTIAGLQNRIGALFFACAFFGFSCLTSIQSNAAERVIFVRERANRYYSPIMYYCSKILFDMIPLRVIPAVIFGAVFYPMAGLQSSSYSYFLTFLMLLIAFNLTAAAVCMTIGFMFKDVGVASLMCSMIMLFEVLFSGIPVHKADISPKFAWLFDLSFFNMSFESLLNNEVAGQKFTGELFGAHLDNISGLLVLKLLGFFVNNNIITANMTKLVMMFGGCIVVSFLWLQLFVREQR